MSSRALAQRRQGDRDDVQPVVEIGAERAVRDGGREIAVRRRETRTSTRGRPVAADALELALLEDAQQRDLRLRRQLAHLVEEDRAAVGGLEPPDAALQRAGEGAALVSRTARTRSASGGIAPQFTRTNGPAARAERSWMARAISSLPVPVSPRISTVASVGATRATRASTRRSAGDSPTMSAKAPSSAPTGGASARPRNRGTIARSGKWTSTVMSRLLACFDETSLRQRATARSESG